ncbi:PDZ domain-containing protein [Paenactinomyces guangxiensis]|uniref:PDZ domain-containing protein n=1 Tax=Paenactinomyces guangxiensis TaxID=1490290 RepID=A0A7W2A882_9BACL|nr:PDZ domain-containing protein [Paenactinomyces guangxiensis]MBA4495331.1 PDZ domain-containing protein [Paenactinomyces guangxiensis]MBH8592548.1 PDZ domain-containing protein [Paenactinomyces guangxiensis]
MSYLWDDPLSYGSAWISLFSSPWIFLACLLSLIQNLWIVRLERKRFGRRLEPPVPLILRNWFFGMAAGVALSFLLSAMEWEMDAEELLWVWAVTLLFSAGGVRFSCLSYSAGILTLASLGVQRLGSSPFPERWDKLWNSLEQFSGTGWLWLIGIVHLLEWALIRVDGDRGVLPIQIKHRTGQWINGFLLKKGWPIPLVILSADSWMPLPVFISFARLNISKPVKQQKRLASTLTCFYGIMLCGLMLAAAKWKGVLWAAAVFAVLGHETIYQWGRWQEKQKEPFFVSDQRGLKVLAVLPGSPAATLGIKSGDVIQRLNGVRVRSMEELEEQTKRAAFCKLEVLDERLDRHMMQKALYEDDPRHLGIVGAIPLGIRNPEPKQEVNTAGKLSKKKVHHHEA